MKNEPIEIKTKIVGVTHMDPVNKVNRQEIIHKMVKAGQKLELRLEPDNAYDPDAVAVWLRRKVLLSTSEYHLGYLGRDVASDVSVLIKQGRRITTTVLDVSGGSEGKVTHGVNIVIRAQ